MESSATAGGGSARVSWQAVPLAALTYTVVDVETTGLKPEGNGITEICCLRVIGGQVVGRFDTLVNPGRPIPPFIAEMTGITDAMVRHAPHFRDVIPTFLDFLGESVLVAHHAPFDLSFLNYGLYCSGYRNLHNPVMDTRRLARRLLPGLSRGNLDAVAGHLGIAIQARHRAYGDAEATAQVLVRLLALCIEQGIESDSQLLSLVAPRSATRGSRSPSRKGEWAARLSVLAERCRAFPDAPGVYLMRSASGRVLYVGKAVSLRKRLASYFNGGVPKKIKRMLREVESIEHVQLGSELEALLEESRLIKRHDPPFNTLLRTYRNYPFIKVDESGPYPRLTLTRKVEDDSARYFGPFRSVRGTELALAILSRCFRLFDDRCPGRTNGEACAYWQMGRCLAPCLGEEQRSAYREAVEEVCRLLETRPEELVADLVRRREAAAERLDFETAAVYRDGIDALDRAVQRRRLLAPAIEGLNVLAVCPSTRSGWAELFVFGDGRLLARERVSAVDGVAGRVAVEGLLETVARRWSGPEHRPAIRIDAESLDQVNVISDWLERQGASACTTVLEPGWADTRFHEIVAWILETASLVASSE